jgi:hypothetical protein
MPELVAERLRLRGFEARDFEAYAAMMAERVNTPRTGRDGLTV